MLIPGSWSIPSAHPYFPFGTHKLVFNICKSVSVSWLSSFLPFKKIRFYTYVMSYDIRLWLTSLRMLISRPIHIAARGMVSFSFMAEQCPIACMYHSFFIHSVAVHGHLGAFHVLVLVNSPAVSIGVHISSLIMIFFEYILRSGIAGSCGSPVFSFLVVVPIYIGDHAHFKREMLKGIWWRITEDVWKSKSVARSLW